MTHRLSERRRRLMRERSTIRRGRERGERERGREVTRDRLNGNSERRTDGRTDRGAKVGTSSSVQGERERLHIRTDLFGSIHRSLRLDHLKNRTDGRRDGAGGADGRTEEEGDREQWSVYSRCHQKPGSRGERRNAKTVLSDGDCLIK